MIAQPNPDLHLSNFLRRIVLLPNRRALDTVCALFQSCLKRDFPIGSIKVNQEFKQRFFLAKAKLQRMENVPELLQNLMKRCQECVNQNLRIDPVLLSHLQKLTEEKNLDISSIDNLISAVELSGKLVTFSDLTALLGSDWGGTRSNGIHSANSEFIQTIETFYSLIYSAATLNSGTQSILWKKSQLDLRGLELAVKLTLGKEGKLSPPTATDLEAIKKFGETVYFPIGYANFYVFFISLLAIDYTSNGYRLRLLASDNSHVLASGSKKDHYCPEVIWEELQIDQLINPDFWKPLLEAATLKEEEQRAFEDYLEKTFLAVNSTHFVSWITKKLGKHPHSRYLKIDEGVWIEELKNKWGTCTVNCHNSHLTTTTEQQNALFLKPTGKEIKRTIFDASIRKFVNLLPLDLLPSKKDRLLFKAESRLLLMVGAYMTLKKGAVPPLHRSNFLRLVEQSWGKITTPIEALMDLEPSKDQLEAARVLLVSVIDLKSRLAELVRGEDRITLAAPLSLYGSTHKAHQLKFSEISLKPIKFTLLDLLRLHEGVPALTYHQQWNGNLFPDLYSQLESWYHLLLDEKRKCEPAELMTLAHRNVFSKLPIPMTDDVKATFPDPISEGLQVGTLLLLKKISSLVASEVYSAPFVPPLFFADMARVYRFSWELYRHINPTVCQMPVSWYGLYQYLESRHSFHIPGAVKETLDALASSFKIISPKGHLKPFENFQEIPLFYFSWQSLPKTYKHHRKTLGPFRIVNRSVEEVLTLAELADSVGLKLGEVDSYRSTKWENNFGGQCYLALKEIAQYYTMGAFASTHAYQNAFNQKSYRENNLFQSLGPEDHFQLEPCLIVDGFDSYKNSFGINTKYGKQVESGETPFSQRMVFISNKKIREPLCHLPIKRVEEWREQAELIKLLPKSQVKGGYHLNQISSGPAPLSLDMLLEYFEARSYLLLNQDYRSYFWAVIRSARVLESACQSEPLLLDRLKDFITTLFKEDRQTIADNNLNFERLLWLSSVTRHLCRLSSSSQEKFSPLLGQILHDLYHFGRGEPYESRIAPHLLASQPFLVKDFQLSLLEIGRLHLLIGRNPPIDPNDFSLWLETCEAMQNGAPQVQNALLNGDETTRRALWSLIFTEKQDIEEVLKRFSQSIPIETLLKITVQGEKLKIRQAYLNTWEAFWKKYSSLKDPWRESATRRSLKKIENDLATISAACSSEETSLFHQCHELLLTTPTTLLVQMKGKMILVDWQTGRMAGVEQKLSCGQRLPVHIRKHPDLAPLRELLTRPMEQHAESGKIHFQGIPELSFEMSSSAVKIQYNGQLFRLMPLSNLPALELPHPFCQGFSAWLNEEEAGDCYGLLTAHAQDGTPYLSFSFDRFGLIRSLKGNPHLHLAGTGFYPEAHLFSRWGIDPKNILVWLDDNCQVAELHLPLHNGVDPFTRVTRNLNGTWKIEGLDLILESTHEAIGAFVEHPVYLVAKNREGHPLLLLSSTSPYEIQKRVEKPHTVDWNQILSSKAEEGIHQYRILPSGDVEGITVADNLLLMIWKLKMGHYATCAELAKRWLTPPGRTYTDIEVEILKTWISTTYGDAPMHTESHPSALALRLYVIGRMTRHLRHFPPKNFKGKMSEFAKEILGNGKNGEGYKLRYDLTKSFLGRGTLSRQVRGTHLSELLSTYDHEAILRLLDSDEKKTNSPFLRNLYQRINFIPSDHQLEMTRVVCKIYNRKIHDYKESKYAFQQLVRHYPNKIQTDKIPIEQIYRSLVSADLSLFFDKAYSLIKDGARKTSEMKEYEALLYAFQQLRGPKALDLCLNYVHLSMSHYGEVFSEDSLLLWLILEQTFLAKAAGKTLPELPSLQKRFGLTLKESKKGTKAFFSKLLEFSGTDAENLLQRYREEWFAKKGIRVIEQDTLKLTPPDYFYESLCAPRSNFLTKEILRWKNLYFSKTTFQTRGSDEQLPGWSYLVPAEWAEISLYNLQPKLLERLHFLTEEKGKREKKLLLLANELPEKENLQLREFARQIHYAEPLSTDECIHLSLQTKPQLQQSVLDYLEVALEAAHLQRCQKELEYCLKSPDDQERLTLFKENLTTPHHYLPCAENLPLMIAEYYSDLRLRTQPDQANLIRILTSNTKGSIIQAIMGSGKSKMLAPVWLKMMLAKGHIPLFSVPNSLFQTTLSDLQDMMWKWFKIHVRALSFDRESCTIDTLYNLIETLYIAKLEPTVFLCTPRDLHAMQLMLKERHQVVEDMRERLMHYTLNWSRSILSIESQEEFQELLKDNFWDSAEAKIPEHAKEAFKIWFKSHARLEDELKPLMEEADLMQAILNLFQHEAALLVDEVANSYDPRNLLSFPIGWQTQANPQAGAVACKIYFEWLVPHYEKLNLLNNMQSLSQEMEREEIYRKVAEQAWQEYRELLPQIPPLDTFTAYMLSNFQDGRPMQDFVYQIYESKSALERQIAQELAFLKYSLTVGLEGALTSTGHVNYGRSKQDPHLYVAIPYQCANVPKENTLFRRPWKTVLMTCQLYSQGWKDSQQTEELVGFLQGIDPTSKDLFLLKGAALVWGHRFTDVDLMNKKEMERLTLELDAARLDPEKGAAARLLISTYLRSCVFPTQLKLDPSQLASTPQDIPMMTFKADAMGGTFGFEATWNTRLQRVPDHSIDNLILKCLAEPRNQTCQALPKGGSEAFFTHLGSGVLDKYIAFIDAGALFKGFSNESVAKRFLKNLKEHDSVIFFDEEYPDGARLAIMSASGKISLEVSDPQGISRVLSQNKLYKPFAYYDQARCIGAHLQLVRGEALVTFSDTVTLDDLLQACMRCRGLLEGRHSVVFLVPQEMGENWTGNKVVETAKDQQKKLEAKANFHGICEQLRGEVRATIDRAMRGSESAQLRHNLYRSAKSFLLEMQDNDLVKTFGSLKGIMRTSDALHHLIEHLVGMIGKILPKSKEEVKKGLESIVEWHKKRGTIFPEWVREEDVHEDAVQEVDLNKDQDRMRLMEEEYERMLGTRNPKKEIAWTQFDSHSIKASPLGTFTECEGRPTLYSLKEALKERGFITPISPNLLISANLLATFVSESNCLLTENQKPVHRILYIRSKDEPKLVLVSEGDARYLKEHLLNLPNQEGKGIYLLEPTGAINQRGWRGEKISNLWEQETRIARSYLLQVLVFQGSALMIERLPENEVAEAFKFWTNQKKDYIREIRILFEAALEFSPENMHHYRRSKKLRMLFN